MERANHARHVAQRKLLLPPLGERPRRLAFKVDDHEVVARNQHLAEVIISVATNLGSVDGQTRRVGKLLLDRPFSREQTRCPLRGIALQARRVIAQ